MFKWIIIITLMTNPGENQTVKYLQGDSLQNFTTEAECMHSMNQEISALANSVLEDNTQVEVNLAQCAWYSTLKTNKGLSS